MEYGSYTQAGIIRKIMTQIFILEKQIFEILFYKLRMF